MSRIWRNWYQNQQITYINEVDEQIKGVYCRDNVRHNLRSDQLFLERMMNVAEQE